MKQEKVSERIALLRQELRREHLSAYIFLTSDPHQSEYTADYWKGREWISGFSRAVGGYRVPVDEAEGGRYANHHRVAGKGTG